MYEKFWEKLWDEKVIEILVKKIMRRKCKIRELLGKKCEVRRDEIR